MRNKIKIIKITVKDPVKDLDSTVFEIIDEYEFYNDDYASLAILYIYAKHVSDDIEVLYKWSYIENEMKDISPEDLIYLAFTKGRNSHDIL